MILPADVARCRGIKIRGDVVLMCAYCERRRAYLDDRERGVERMLVIEPPERVIDCTMRIVPEEER